jgi:hypothetical protein
VGGDGVLVRGKRVLVSFVAAARVILPLASQS